MSTTTMERLVVAVEWDAKSVKVDDDGNVTELEGYASTFGNVDLGGDRIDANAFDKTIANIKANGIPFLADHMPTVASVLGTIFDAKADDHGLKIKVRFSKAPSAQDAALKAKEGHVNRMSIGYEALDYSFEDTDDGRRIRILKEIKLWETSAVVFPMNPEAVISRVKSWVNGVSDDAIRGTLVAELKSHVDDLTELGVDLPEIDQKEANPDEGKATEDPDEGKSADTDPESAAGDEPDEQSDEDAKSWDHWQSEAVLAGHDPDEVADPADVAGMQKALELIEADLAERDAPVDEAIRKGLAASLDQIEGDLDEIGSRVPADQRSDLTDSLSKTEQAIRSDRKD